MIVKYDKDADVAYIHLNKEKPLRKVNHTLSCEVNVNTPMIFIDLDKENKILGFEILDASLFLPELVLKNAQSYNKE